MFQFIDSCQHSPTIRMAHHHDQAGAKLLGGELDAADLRRRDDVASNADDEQVA